MESLVFVLKDAIKKFAYETKEAAMNSFMIRKYKQIIKLKDQLYKAETTFLQSKQSYPKIFDNIEFKHFFSYQNG
jgi:hypothetical protein